MSGLPDTEGLRGRLRECPVGWADMFTVILVRDQVL
jgi:hypothetical protein